jgi:cytosine/adenosine deaminase-related metal-dependent hydrolase
MNLICRALFLATGDVLPLNDKGERVWPKAQDEASFVLVDASCSAEAVARISPRTATFHKGQLVWGNVASWFSAQRLSLLRSHILTDDPHIAVNPHI